MKEEDFKPGIEFEYKYTFLDPDIEHWQKMITVADCEIKRITSVSNCVSTFKKEPDRFRNVKQNNC